MHRIDAVHTSGLSRERINVQYCSVSLAKKAPGSVLFSFLGLGPTDVCEARHAGPSQFQSQVVHWWLARHEEVGIFALLLGPRYRARDISHFSISPACLPSTLFPNTCTALLLDPLRGRVWLLCACDLTEVRLASFALDTSTSQLRINPSLSHTLSLRLSGCCSVQLSSQTPTNRSSELLCISSSLAYPRANLLG